MTPHVQRTPGLLIVGGAVAMALALSGCSDSTASTAGDPAVVVTEQSAATPGASQAPLPLDAYQNSLFGLSGSYSEIQHQLYERDVKRENLVAACMKEQGFSYTPDAVENTALTGQIGPSDADLGSEKWVKQYGYGVVYTEDGATGTIDQATLLNAEKRRSADTSPNGAYVASLTPTEKAAYDKAMHGSDGTDSTLTIAEDWKELGCSGAALHALKSENAVMDSATGKAVQASISAFYDGYATWPGVADTDDDWATCMAKNGHAGFTKQSDPIQQFRKQHDALWQGVEADSAPSTADLNALATQERATALVDLRCQNTTHYAARIRVIEVVQQKQFMSDNKAQLDALKAEATAG